MIRKQECLIITSSFLKQSFNDFNIMVGDSNIVSSNSARNLGVVFDKSTCFHLRNIRSILSNDACVQLIHSLVTVCLDYCNSILYWLPDNSLYLLQKIQNSAARILARLPRFYHISVTLFDLQWLPIRYRITFKIGIITLSLYCTILSMWFNCSICQYTVSKSNDKGWIKPCKPRLRSYGERCFMYDGPQEWNNLPIHIRKSASLSIFKTQLKTYLFQLAYPNN